MVDAYRTRIGLAAFYTALWIVTFVMLCPAILKSNITHASVEFEKYIIYENCTHRIFFYTQQKLCPQSRVATWRRKEEHCPHINIILTFDLKSCKKTKWYHEWLIFRFESVPVTIMPSCISHLGVAFHRPANAMPLILDKICTPKWPPTPVRSKWS